MEVAINNKEEVLENDKSTVYELGFLILPSVTEEKLPEMVSSFKSMIEENGGSFVSEGFPVLKPISYTMFKPVDNKKTAFNQAYFGWIKFELGSAKIKLIQKTVEENPDILRILLIKTVKENTLYSSKVFAKKEKISKKSAPLEEKSSDEEIDKSIEDLVS